MTRNKGNNVDRVHFNSYRQLWIRERDKSAIHTTFQGTQYKTIIDLLNSIVNSRALLS